MSGEISNRATPKDRCPHTRPIVTVEGRLYSKQAIYVWNGADSKYLDLFARDFSATKITLTENFRCSRAVVSAAQRLDPSYSRGTTSAQGVG